MSNGIRRQRAYWSALIPSLALVGCASDANPSESGEPEPSSFVGEASEPQAASEDPQAVAEEPVPSASELGTATRHCKEYQSTQCRRAFECLTDEQLAANRDVLLDSQAACIEKFTAPCDEDPGCANNEGLQFNVDQSRECIDVFKEATCEEYIAYSSQQAQAPLPCQLICTAPLDPGECFGQCSCTCSNGTGIAGLIGGACTCDEACAPASGTGTCR